MATRRSMTRSVFVIAVLFFVLCFAASPAKAQTSLDLSPRNDSMTLPVGTSAQRPASPVAGMIRYNSTVPQVEAYYSGAWQGLLSNLGSITLTLGTSASATNPQRSGQAGTGLFSATTGTVSISASGTDVADFASTGLNLPGATLSYQINGNNAVWQDNTNDNIAIGPTAFSTNVSQSGGGNNGSADTAVGWHALNANTTGYQNTAVGYVALAGTTTGYNNTALGEETLFGNTTGIRNTAVGAGALRQTTTGGYNTAMGDQALRNNTTGINNTAIGASALNTNTTGIRNTAIGDGALQNVTTGSNNTAIGYLVGGSTLVTGINNILIGVDNTVDTGSAGTNYNLNIATCCKAT